MIKPKKKNQVGKSSSQNNLNTFQASWPKANVNFSIPIIETAERSLWPSVGYIYPNNLTLSPTGNYCASCAILLGNGTPPPYHQSGHACALSPQSSIPWLLHPIHPTVSMSYVPIPFSPSPLSLVPAPALILCSQHPNLPTPSPHLFFFF